jgi:hypothetical protein
LDALGAHSNKGESKVSEIMTEEQADEFVKKGGEYGLVVAQLTQRCITAETRADALEKANQLQCAEIDRLLRESANLNAQLSDALRDVGLMSDGLMKVGGTIKEVNAQRLAAKQPSTVQQLEPHLERVVLEGRPRRREPDLSRLSAEIQARMPSELMFMKRGGDDERTEQADDALRAG